MSLYRLALNHIPRPLLIRLSYVFKWIAPLFLSGDRFEDPIDGKTYRKLLPYGYGKVQRPNALSPSSHSLERHRLLWLYLKRETDFFQKKSSLLHIAPEQCFLDLFRKMEKLEYLTADLNSPIADISLDVQQMPFEDERFDMILCNHVLNTFLMTERPCGRSAGCSGRTEWPSCRYLSDLIGKRPWKTRASPIGQKGKGFLASTIT